MPLRRTWPLILVAVLALGVYVLLVRPNHGEQTHQPPSAGGNATAKPPAGAGKAAPRVFAPNSVWNATLPAGAPLDPSSPELVADLRRQLTLGAPWINTTSYSTPVYRVPANQPKVRVTLDVPYPPLQQAFDAVPLPADARPANGSDAHLVVWQRATDTMWEFWHLAKVHGAWHARWGGRMTHVSRSPGYYTGSERTWGATATSLPLLGGLITLDDLAHHRIDHALALSIPHARSKSWSWPAQRTDGNSNSAQAVPEGTRFRLDPALDVNRLNVPPLVKMMAQAAQRYGIVVRDQAGVVAFSGEDPSPTGRNPWSERGGWFRGQYASTLVRQFPWDHLEALRTDQRSQP